MRIKPSLRSRALALAAGEASDKHRADLEHEGEFRALEALFIGEKRAARTPKPTVYTTSTAIH